MNELPEPSPEEIGAGTFSRHAKSLRHIDGADSASEEFSSLTIHGVEQARETARTKLLENIKKSPAGSVLFIGGKSDQDRTGQTAEVYGDELKKFEESDNLTIITKKQIESFTKMQNDERGFSPSQIILVLRKIKQIVNERPNQKIVITYPLEIKQLGYEYGRRWTHQGKKIEYFDKLVKKYHGSHARAVHDWLKNQGKLTLDDGTIIEGPKPEIVAKEYLHGLSRLYQFTKNQLGNRPVEVLAVGHQWDLDAVVTYLARGRVTYQDWTEIMGRQGQDIEKQVIGETELISNISIDPDTRKTTVRYRDKNFSTEFGSLDF